MNRKSYVISRRLPMIAKWWAASVLALLALLTGHGLGAELPNPPPKQPEKMWSPVDYDPNLTDPFFESEEWSYPRNIILHPDGHFEDISSDKRPEKEPPRLKHTAKCFSTSFGSTHLVKFCEAKFLGVNRINLLIREFNPADNDALRIQIRNGMFTSEYWTVFRRKPIQVPFAIWTTTRQKLTLDKKAYRKGDVIKGRIDFECVQRITDPILVEKFGGDPTTIKLYGVFNTIVQ